jgi:drug/metabolite transporter (DMT)-like permease
MKKEYAAHIALTIVALIYAGNYLVAKEVLDPGHIKPFGFILLRAVTGVVAFWLVDLLFFREKVKRADLPWLAMCGVFGVAINQLCFFAGLKLTAPINASLLMTLTPILVLIASAIYYREKASVRKISGIFLGIFGAVLLITRGFTVPFSWDGRILGDTLIVVNASSYAVYLVLVKKMMVKYSPLVVIKWVFTFGLIPVALIGWGDIPDIEWSGFSSRIYLYIAYVLLLTTVLAYFLNVYSLTIVSPTITSIYIYLQPLFTTIFSIMLAKDHLDLVKTVAGILILAGVFLVSYQKPRK